MFDLKSALKNWKRSWVPALLTAALLLTACTAGGDNIPDTGPAAVSSPTVQTSSHPELGNILVDENGMTLYIFTQDGPGQSNCTGNCLTNWPPLLAAGSLQAGQGLDQALLGTAPLEDGSQIVTYNQRPLYYWAQDSAPGEASGHGVGGVWFALSPTGNPVGQ